MKFRSIFFFYFSCLALLLQTSSISQSWATQQSQLNFELGCEAQLLPDEVGLEHVAHARESLIALAKKHNLPAFVRNSPTGKVPVILLNDKSFPVVKSHLAGSLGMPIEMIPGSATDHGLSRIGLELGDMMTPGRRWQFLDKNMTGILWRDLNTWLPNREEKFQKRSEGTYDGRPTRIAEVAYTLTPGEREIAEVYHRSRYAGLWRIEYAFQGSEHAPYVHVTLGLPGDRANGREHCYNFATCRQWMDHINEIYHKLYHEVGIREDLPKWFERPEVVEYQDKAWSTVLGVNSAGIDNWSNLHPRLLETPELISAMRKAVPGFDHLSPEQKLMLLNLTFAERAIRKYNALTQELDIHTSNFLDYNNPRVTAIYIYEGEDAAASFRNASYDYKGGTVAGFFNDGKNEPIH